MFIFWPSTISTIIMYNQRKITITIGYYMRKIFPGHFYCISVHKFRFQARFFAGPQQFSLRVAVPPPPDYGGFGGCPYVVRMLVGKIAIQQSNRLLVVPSRFKFIKYNPYRNNNRIQRVDNSSSNPIIKINLKNAYIHSNKKTYIK